MDEPDLDELEWMAAQDEPPDFDDFDNFDEPAADHGEESIVNEAPPVEEPALPSQEVIGQRPLGGLRSFPKKAHLRPHLHVKEGPPGGLRSFPKKAHLRSHQQVKEGHQPRLEPSTSTISEEPPLFSALKGTLPVSPVKHRTVGGRQLSKGGTGDEPDIAELEWMAMQEDGMDGTDTWDDFEELDKGDANPSALNLQSSRNTRILQSNPTPQNPSSAKSEPIQAVGPCSTKVVLLDPVKDAFVDKGDLSRCQQPPVARKPEPLPTPFEELTKVFRRATDVEGSIIPVSYGGERVYTQLRNAGEVNRSLNGLRAFSKLGGCGDGRPLLSEPIDQMIERVEADRFQRALKTSVGESQPTIPENEREALREQAGVQLWVDKYSPRTFTELLSDERINREVLRWLKQWDPCAFGESKVATSAEVLSVLRRKAPNSGIHAGHRQQRGGFASGGQGRYSGRGRGESGSGSTGWGEGREESHGWSGGRGQGRGGPVRQSNTFRGGFSKGRFGSSGGRWSSEVGGRRGGTEGGGQGWKGFGGKEPMKNGEAVSKGLPQDRPDEKVLLLCGAPGLGKTTLAHVVARHCGYRVVEVNASDDRVANTIRSRILDAVQMQSVISDGRPNCLIIDEIDGAFSSSEGKGAIGALLEIVLADQKLASKGKEDEGPKKSKSKKNASGVKRLSRPVICICNDLYAPALRPLRQVARVVVFTQPSVNRVVNRLRQICSAEGFKTDSRSLTALATHTECDIRSCLNTLQFLQRKCQGLRAYDIASQVVGRKDVARSMFDIWNKIFQRRAPRGIGGKFTEVVSGELHEFTSIHTLVSTHGDHDLVLEGIFENFLRVRYHDVSLLKTVVCLNWISDSELWGYRAMAKQQFWLTAYRAIPVLAIRRQVAGPERPVIEWPKANQNYRTQRGSREELVLTWQQKMAPSVARNLSMQSIVVDIVSPLLTILAPLLRPIAAQLFTAREKQEVADLVDSMIALGLTYKVPKQISQWEGSNQQGGQPNWTPATWQLEPPIGLLTRFEEHSSDNRQLNSAVKQMIAHEVELETIRREGASRQDPQIDAKVVESPIAEMDRAHPPSDTSPVIPTNGGNSASKSGPPIGKQGTASAAEALFSKLGRSPKQGAKRVLPAPPVDFFSRFKKAKTKGNESGVQEKVSSVPKNDTPKEK